MKNKDKVKMVRNIPMFRQCLKFFFAFTFKSTLLNFQGIFAEFSFWLKFANVDLILNFSQWNITIILCTLPPTKIVTFSIVCKSLKHLQIPTFKSRKHFLTLKTSVICLVKNQKTITILKNTVHFTYSKKP